LSRHVRIGEIVGWAMSATLLNQARRFSGRQFGYHRQFVLRASSPPIPRLGDSAYQMREGRHDASAQLAIAKACMLDRSAGIGETE
jgi:hypothetical protein